MTGLMTRFFILTGFSSNDMIQEPMSPYIYAGLTKQGVTMFRTQVRNNDPQYIINTICQSLNIEKRVLLGLSRKRNIAVARHICISLILKSNPHLSLKRVGMMFGRDHSTVIHSKDTYEDLMQFDKPFQAIVNQVKIAL